MCDEGARWRVVECLGQRGGVYAPVYRVDERCGGLGGVVRGFLARSRPTQGRAARWSTVRELQRTRQGACRKLQCVFAGSKPTPVLVGTCG